jgi:hypothetical protein
VSFRTASRPLSVAARIVGTTCVSLIAAASPALAGGVGRPSAKFSGAVKGEFAETNVACGVAYPQELTATGIVGPATYTINFTPSGKKQLVIVQGLRSQWSAITSKASYRNRNATIDATLASATGGKSLHVHGTFTCGGLG